MQKLATKIISKLSEELPKNAKVGKKYSKVVVDGETFKNLTLMDINPSQATMIFKGPKKHTFNYVEQEIVLS